MLSIHLANQEQAYLPPDRAARLTAKLVIDGVGARMAKGVGAVILLWLLFVMLVAWIFSTRILGQTLAKQLSTNKIIQEAQAESPLHDS